MARDVSRKFDPHVFVHAGSILLDLFSGQSGHGHLVIFDSGNAVICSLYINKIFIL